jgi:hypothetical protein
LRVVRGGAIRGGWGSRYRAGMKRVAIVLVLLGLSVTATAHAELDHLGSFRFGQKLAKAKPVEMEIFGCKGTLSARIKKKKVVEIRFEADLEGNCGSEAEDQDAVRERLRGAIAAEVHARPVIGPQGDALWEGTQTSVLLTTQSPGPGFEAPRIQIVAATTTPRICWAEDGFASFFAEFKRAVAAGKPDGLVRFFAFPFRDEVGEASFRSAKDFTAHADRLLTPDSKAAIAAESAPWCSLEDQEYLVLLPEPHGRLTAERRGGTWHFTGVTEILQD